MESKQIQGPGPRDTANYVFDNAAVQARTRLGAISAVFDPGTIRHLSERGIKKGWRCLEVGGGGGSIASWLCESVGAEGSVVATDIDTRFLDTLRLPNIEVRHHNVVTESLPEAAFDLAHARLVLLHLPEWEKALRRMVLALKPGGWLVAEEFDSLSMRPDPSANPGEVLLKTYSAIGRMLTEHGADIRFGRSLFERLRAQGLVDVGTEARMFMWQAGSHGASLYRANFVSLRADLIQAGYVTEEEFERDLARLEETDFLAPSPIMWTAWGRLPPA